MRLLLDTHLLLWALAEPDRLDAVTRAALEDPGNEVLFSAASLWEIAIKAGLGRADFAFEPQQILLFGAGYRFCRAAGPCHCRHSGGQAAAASPRSL